MTLPPLPPMPSNFDKPQGELTENEFTFILDTELNKKRRHDTTVLAFIDCFIRCKHIGQASEEVGIKPSLGYRIRHYKDVANAIQKLTDKSAIKYGFDASEIMERTKELVDFDPIMLMNPDGTFKSNLHEIQPEARRSLKKLKVKNLYSKHKDLNGIESRIITGEVVEYEFYDKLKAIDLAGREKELFKTTTKVEHTVSNNMAELLLASASRGTEASKEFIELDKNGERDV